MKSVVEKKQPAPDEKMQSANCPACRRRGALTRFAGAAFWVCGECGAVLNLNRDFLGNYPELLERGALPE